MTNDPIKYVIYDSYQQKYTPDEVKRLCAKIDMAMNDSHIINWYEYMGELWAIVEFDTEAQAVQFKLTYGIDLVAI